LENDKNHAAFVYIFPLVVYIISRICFLKGNFLSLCLSKHIVKKILSSFWKTTTLLIKHNVFSLKINWAAADDSFVFIAVAILSKLDLTTHYEEKAFNAKHEFHFKVLTKREFALGVIFGKQQVKPTLLVISHGRAKVWNLHFFAEEFANATIWPFRPGCFEVWRIRLAAFFPLSSKPTSKSWNLHALHSCTRKIWMNKFYQAEKSGDIH